MRYQIAWVLLVSSLSQIACGDDDVAKSEKIHVDGQTLILASSVENTGESLKEYIPAGEKLDSWTRLASIRTSARLPKPPDPKAFARSLIINLKKQNSNAPSQVTENAKTGQVIVDFVTWPSDMSFVELTVFRIAKSQDDRLIVQQYSVREHKEPEKFLKELQPLKERLVKTMAKDGLEVTK
jgi:hypothetical protein